MTDNKLDFWIQNNYNVLFVGRHGTGKTTRIIEAFNRNNIKWKYFSAATLDPWTDLVGIPKEAKDQSGNSYLDFILPKDFSNDEVEAIFFDEYNRCLSGDTKILSPDGNSYKIKDLVGKEYFYTYSFDQKTNKICIGKGHSARITHKNAKILKVTLDNGTYIKCTPDHPFLLKSGEYKQAQYLTPEESLMPLYKIWNENGYEKIYQPKSNGRFDLTYCLANQYNINSNKYKHTKLYHKHHIDFNKNNNSPDNIIELSRDEHFKIHGENSNFLIDAGKKALHKNHLMRIVNLMIDTNLKVETENDYNILLETAKKNKKPILKYSTFVKLFTFKELEELRNVSFLKRKTINHKIVSIEECGFEDVYDITVDSYGNFALEAGIFVHNSPSKVRNATMELLQFKSINGKKFKNLKFIWAAINPEKDLNDDSAPEYDVEALDPAQKDRFEIHVEVPYKPDITYFKNKYGDDIGKTAVSWWNDLNDKEKDEVSPRRLDYAIGLYIKSGDLRDVLNKKINVSKLVGELKNGNFREQMENIYKNRDLEKASAFIKDENSYNNTIKYILQDKNKLDFFFKYVPEEKQSNLVATDDVAMKYAFNNMDKYNVIVQRASIANTKIAKALAKWMKNKPMDVTNFDNFSFSSTKLKFAKPPRAMGTSGYKSYTDMINSEMTESTKGTAYRKNAFKSIAWALYNDKGYGNPTPTNPLTEKEAKLTLDGLNNLIDSIYQFENFKELPQVYGLVCGEYLKRFGKKQTYNKLTRKVQEFLNLHGNMYI